MTKPQCTEVSVTASAGGKVQIVHYKLHNDFLFSHTEKYSIPEGWDSTQVEEFKTAKTSELKQTIDQLAQVEQDALLQSSDWYK